MGYRKVYTSTEQCSLSQIEKLMDFNYQVKRFGIDNLDDAKLQSALGSLSAILGIVAVGVSSTPYAITCAIIGALGALGVSDKRTVKAALQFGYDDLYDIRDAMKKQNFSMVEAQVTWLEFEDEGFRTVYGADAKRYKQGNGWIS